MARRFAVLVLLAANACIIPAPSGEKSSPGRARAVVGSVPPLNAKSGAIFGGKAELLGATVAPGRLVPGEQVKVTLYFKVLEPLDEDYTLFVHVEDPAGRVERMNVDHRPAGGTYPTTEWRKGETVRDEFAFFVPSGQPLTALNVWLGFWEPTGDARLPISNPTAVRHDGRDRLLLASLPVEG